MLRTSPVTSTTTPRMTRLKPWREPMSGENGSRTISPRAERNRISASSDRWARSAPLVATRFEPRRSAAGPERDVLRSVTGQPSIELQVESPLDVVQVLAKHDAVLVRELQE